jgi:transcription factor AP-1
MEQEDYAKGFEDALKNLHESNNEQAQPTKATTGAALNPSSTVSGMSGGGITTYTDEANLMLPIKEEPQTHVEHEQMNPIDMESQEKIKLERKRQRNRVAASKCRKRKLGN